MYVRLPSSARPLSANNPKVLARVRAFLPQMEASNAVLSQAEPKSVDIENVTEADQQYIEMVRRIHHVSYLPSPSFCLCSWLVTQNLGLGVFEDRATASHPESTPDSEDTDPSSSSDSSDSDNSTSASDSSDSDDSVSESDSSTDIVLSVTSRPIKQLPKRARPRPEIVELSDHPSAS